jgi:hypothetical protein
MEWAAAEACDAIVRDLAAAERRYTETYGADTAGRVLHACLYGTCSHEPLCLSVHQQSAQTCTPLSIWVMCVANVQPTVPIGQNTFESADHYEESNVRWPVPPTLVLTHHASLTYTRYLRVHALVQSIGKGS